ncbi:DUF5336 domain-containing protein [Nocardia sp. NPDC005366]|uniref:DUF5336 domain-containing protein n=1 Tax=Nocardia sp. NPDC005366 TaxID=3156878 RepID=UPI0033AFE858
MSYPTGGSGYNTPATPSASSDLGQSPSGAAGTGSSASGSDAKGLPFFLVVGVAALGAINFLLGFLPYAAREFVNPVNGKTTTADSANGFEAPITALLAILLFAGVLAGLSLLPKQNWKAVAAAASVAGFLGIVLQSFFLNDDATLKWGAYLLIFLALVQAGIAVAAVLFEAGILKPPAPKPATAPAPQAGYGQGGYGQQAYGQSQPGGQYGQTPGQYGQSAYGAQPGAGSQYPSQQPYGQSQPGQPSQPSQPVYGQSQPSQPTYGAAPGQSYGQQPPAYSQQPGYGAPQQGSPYGSPAAQPRPDESATQHFGGNQGQPRPDESATQHFGGNQGQQYGAPGYGQPPQPPQPPQSQPQQPFGSEQSKDPASDATKAFRPSDDNK